MRMPDRPPFHRQSVTDVFAWLDRVASPCGREEVPLGEAAGRRLADAVKAAAALPRCDVAAIDGYAVIAAGTVGASDYSPLPYRAVDGASPLRAGEASPLVSGETLPAHADAVLDPALVEQHALTMEISGTVAPGVGVIAAGEECEAGAPLLHAGRQLRPHDIGWLALAGIETLPVLGRPRVRILLAGHYERDANGPMLAAAIRRDGGIVGGTDEIGDADALTAALRQPDDDLAIVVGGTGQGANDFSVATLAHAGSVDIYGVAMNPGESAAFGRVGERPVILLPGQPLACACAYDLLGSRLVRRLAGHDTALPYVPVERPLARKIASTIGRLEVCRVRLRDGLADPLAIAENRLLRSAVRADGFVVIPENCEGYPAGTRVTVYRYEP